MKIHLRSTEKTAAKHYFTAGADMNNHDATIPVDETFSVISDVSVIRGHIDTICDIEAATFDRPWKEVDFVNELATAFSCSMVLLEHNAVAGYLFARIVLDEISLDKLCVRAECRGRGFGRVLLGAFLAAVRGRYNRMFLEVDSANTAAIRLYTRFGFRTGRIRKAIYENGADAIEMVLAGEGKKAE